MLTDSALLQRYVSAGDETAFTELVGRHLTLVYNAALRRTGGNATLAEEVTQIVFIRLASKASRLQHHPALIGWLHTSTHYATVSLIRREQRRQRREQAAAMSPNLTDSSSPSWESLRPLIDEALDRLNEPDRHAILLRFFSSRSFREIGDEQRISEEAARKRVTRALESLRRQFARRGLATTDTALGLVLGNAPAVATPVHLATTLPSTALTAATAFNTSGAVVFSTASTAKTLSTLIGTCALVGCLGLGSFLLWWTQDMAHQETQWSALRDNAARYHHQIALIGRTESERRATRAKAEKAPAPSVNAAAEENLRAFQTLANSPAYAPIREQEYRLRAEQEFGAFIASHRYPADKAAALRQALARYYEKQMTQGRLMAANRINGDQFQSFIDHEHEALGSELNALLGQTDAAEACKCLLAQEWLREVKNIGLDFRDADAPLSRVQELALAGVLADYAQSHKAAPASEKQRLEAIDPKTGLAVENAATLDDAVAFLSPAQLSLFEKYLREDQLQAALRKRARAEALSARSTP